MRFADVEVGLEFTTGGLRYRKISPTDSIRVMRVKTQDGEVMSAIASAALVIPSDEQVDYVLVQQEPEDPKGLKASIGGTDASGFYCVYRGDRAAVADMLVKVVKDLREGL